MATRARLFEYIDINPKETLPKGTFAKKISMDKLQPFCREVLEYELSEFQVVLNSETETQSWRGLRLALRTGKQLW